MNESYTGWIIAALGVLASIGLALVLYAFVLSPTLKENAKQKRRIAAKEAQLERAEKKEARWTQAAEEMKLDAARTKQKLQDLRNKQSRQPKAPKSAKGAQALMQADQLGQVKEQLEAIADAMGIGLKQVKRTDDTQNGRVTYAMYDVLASGTYSQMIDWIRAATLSDSRICEARSVTIRRINTPEQHFARPAGNRTIQLELKAKLACAGLGTRGAMPTLEYEATDADAAVDALETVQRALSEQPIQRAPFTPHLYRYYESPDLPPLPPDPPSEAELEGSDAVPLKDEKPSINSAAKPESEEATTDMASAKSGATAEPKVTPLTASPLERFTVLAIVEKSGTRTAVLMMPSGKAKAVRLDMRLGNEGGVVADITEDSVVVDIPTKAEPIVLKVAE